MDNLQKQNTSILLIDDDSSDRYKLRKLLSNGDYKISIAIDGGEGYEKFQKETPQIIITDWLMPKLSGTELTQKIRASDLPQPLIIVLSAVKSISAKKMAINSGADYYLVKPVDKKELFNLLNKLNRVNIHNNKILKEREDKNKKNIQFAAVGIAASTGGPPTVKYLIKHLGKIDNTVFFITQHGPTWMLQSLVEFLQRETELNVFLGIDGLTVEPGKIFVAPGNKHLTVGKDLKTHLLDSAPVNFVKPSADPMFKSIAEVFGSKTIGVVLTGMGSDGSIGCGYIYAEGGKIIVEDPATAILHSMPGSVVKLKLADMIVPIDKMPDEIIKLISEII